MLISKNIDRWRIFVNLYFRNYRSLHNLFEPEKVKEIIDKVKEKADIEDNDEMEIKLKEIADYPFEKTKPTFLMKRPFVKLPITIG